MNVLRPSQMSVLANWYVWHNILTFHSFLYLVFTHPLQPEAPTAWEFDTIYPLIFNRLLNLIIPQKPLSF